MGSDLVSAQPGGSHRQQPSYLFADWALFFSEPINRSLEYHLPLMVRPYTPQVPHCFACTVYGTFTRRYETQIPQVARRTIWGSRKAGQAGSGDLLSHGGGRRVGARMAETAFTGRSE